MASNVRMDYVVDSGIEYSGGNLVYVEGECELTAFGSSVPIDTECASPGLYAN